MTGVSPLSPFDLYLLREGTHELLHEKLGAHAEEGGVRFDAWLPDVNAVSVIGEFNHWDPTAHPLHQLGDPSVWGTFVPDARPGQMYKLRVSRGGAEHDVPDPIAFAEELDGAGASVIADLSHDWQEGDWPRHRDAANAPDAPISICVGDAHEAKRLGFTHVLVGATSGFRPSSQSPQELIDEIETLHQQGLGAGLMMQTLALDPSQREFGSFTRSANKFWRETYHADVLIGEQLLLDEGWRDELFGYLAADPSTRAQHHHELVRRMEWAFSSPFVLPLLAPPGYLPGTPEQQLANLRALLAWAFAMPGKKLIQPWSQSQLPLLTGQLNDLYRRSRALHSSDHAAIGFTWIQKESDREPSTVSFARTSTDGRQQIIFVCNFSDVARPNLRLGVPSRGIWKEVLNTDAIEYGGSGYGNMGAVPSTPVPLMGFRQSITITVPPLAGVFFELEENL